MMSVLSLTTLFCTLSEKCQRLLDRVLPTNRTLWPGLCGLPSFSWTGDDASGQFREPRSRDGWELRENQEPQGKERRPAPASPGLHWLCGSAASPRSPECQVHQLPTPHPLGPPGRMESWVSEKDFCCKVKTASSPALPPPKDSPNTP